MNNSNAASTVIKTKGLVLVDTVNCLCCIIWNVDAIVSVRVVKASVFLVIFHFGDTNSNTGGFYVAFPIASL